MHLDMRLAASVLFGPVRNYRFGPLRELIGALGVKIFDIAQVRDPLDVIVSQFFSHGWIYTEKNFDDYTREICMKIQDGSLDIYTYALRDKG